MLREIHHIAAENHPAIDDKRGRVKKHLLSLYLILIKWLNTFTLLMAIKSTGEFIFPSTFMQCSRLILLVLMFYFLTPAGSTSTHRIVSQNYLKGSCLSTMITMQTLRLQKIKCSNCFQHFPLTFTFSTFFILHVLFSKSLKVFLWLQLHYFTWKNSVLHIVG